MSPHDWRKLAAVCLGVFIPTLLLIWHSESTQWTAGWLGVVPDVASISTAGNTSFLRSALNRALASTELPEAPDDDQELARLLWRYVENPELGCRKLRLFGGAISQEGEDAIDGDKFVCLDPPWAPDPTGSEGCLVYSFGINDEWSFDRAMRRFGCEVHAFDPSMTRYNYTVTEFGAKFYKLGLGGRTGRNSHDWPVMTLTEIRRQLGHARRVIDYLKVDIEGDEWAWLLEDSAGLQHVRQMGMELHLDVARPAALRSQYAALRSISQAGFRTVHSNVNRVFGSSWQVAGLQRNVSALNELVWVKI